MEYEGMNPFTSEHDIFRQALRTFVEQEITPKVQEWEEAGHVPRALFEKMGEPGYVGIRIAEEYGGGGIDSG